MNKKLFGWTGALAVFLLSILMLAAPNPAAQAQVVFPTFIATLNLATATRTPTPIQVGNFVWDDFDQDGSQDPGEPGLAGITVQLWNASKTSLLDQDVTNSNGFYSVTAPTPGDYRVRVLLAGVGDYFTVLNAGANDQTDNDIHPTGVNQGFTDVYTFASNLISITTIDAGIVRFRTPTPTRTPTPKNLGNFVWHDLNQDGIQDTAEPGIGGVTVQLWNDAKTVLIDSDLTDGLGRYTVIAPTAGDYRIRVLLPAGASFSPANQGGDNLKDSDILTFPLSNFGFTETISVADNVISITHLDAGLINFVATATSAQTDTPTPTATETPSPTPSDTPTPTPTLTATPTGTDSPAFYLRLPMILR